MAARTLSGIKNISTQTTAIATHDLDLVILQIKKACLTHLFIKEIKLKSNLKKDGFFLAETVFAWHVFNQVDFKQEIGGKKHFQLFFFDNLGVVIMDF